MGRAWLRLGLGLAALSCFFVTTPAANGQIPVITNPADLHFLDLNEQFDPAGNGGSGSWMAKAPMTTGRAGFAISEANGKVYALGGTASNDCTPLSTVEAYDPVMDTWGTLNSTGFTPRQRTGAGTLGDFIYVVGGTNSSACGGNEVATVEAYDWVNDSWSTRTSMNKARRGVGVAVDTANNLIYAIGGGTGTSSTFTALFTVEVYDPVSDTWVTKMPMHKARALPAVAVVNGKIYAVGGQDKAQVAIDTVEEYDPLTDTWTTKNSHMPNPRVTPGSAVLNGKIYIVGGEDTSDLQNTHPVSTVEVYDPSSDTWATGPSMATARRNVGAAAVADTFLCAVGGESPGPAIVGQEFIYQITATNNPFKYNARFLPPGLTLIDPTLGIISGKPINPVYGKVVTFTATNSSGKGSKNVSFYVQPSPTPGPLIVSSTCATGKADPDNEFVFQVLKNNASTNAILTASGLPYPGLSIDPVTGLISGTVASTADGLPQSFGVNLTLTDTSGGTTTATQSFLQLTFVPPDSAVPIITSPSSVNLVLNQFFSYTIAASNPSATFSFLGVDNVLNGALPTGLAFDGTTISGIYTDDTGSAAAVAPKTAATPSLHVSPYTIETVKHEPPQIIQLFATETDAGTGTAPLNFTVGLRDFEVEALTEQATKPYVIFTDDPLTSGNGAALLESTIVGDSVTYTVPVAVAGTYDVKVGIKTNKGKGKFQLKINNVNQGSEQDEYSPTVGYEIRDLGIVQLSAGDQTFQFLVTGTSHNGYQLVFDYIDLVPRSEAEALVVQAHTAPERLVHDPNLSGGEGKLLNATMPGDSITFTEPVAVPGIYNVKVGVKTNKSGGIFQLAILQPDGVTWKNQGYYQDEYSSTPGYKVCDLGAVTLSGDQAFRFTVTGTSQNGYQLVFDYIDLVLSTQLEAEDTGLDPVVSPGTTYSTFFDDPELSGGGFLLQSTKVGDFVTYTVPVAVAGTYDVRVGIKTNKGKGIFQFAILDADGITWRNQGNPQDEYSQIPGYDVRDLGPVTFTTPGSHYFRFSVIDKNVSSIGYQLVFDYIDLIRAEDYKNPPVF